MLAIDLEHAGVILVSQFILDRFQVVLAVVECLRVGFLRVEFVFVQLGYFIGQRLIDR